VYRSGVAFILDAHVRDPKAVRPWDKVKAEILANLRK